jgi:hypothetical protein
MDINKFNAWLKGASPDALARAERALDTGVRRVITRHWETRLESGRWHWMRREVIRKRGTRDYVEDLKANGWAVTTVYEQIRDWLDSQNYLLPIESVPDEVNPREQAIKAAIAEARKAREGRSRAPKPELEDNVRIPWPALYGNSRDLVALSFMSPDLCTVFGARLKVQGEKHLGTLRILV